MTTFFLAIRNLALQRRRYFLIGTAVAAGFALITVISGAAFGAMETVKAKAARYFAGHVSVTGYVNGWPRLDDPGSIEAALRGSSLPIRTIARRTVYYNSDAKLFFGGETVRQRRLVGIDFQTELGELGSLAFSDGSIEGMIGETGRDGILISDSAAKLLGARVGDDVNLYVTTDSGQYNTATLVVRGIFSETSLFGYVAYMRNEDLNALLRRMPGTATDIAVYASSGTDPEDLSIRVRDALVAGFSPYPRLASKEELRAALASGGEGERLAVLSLDAHLAQIKSLLDAFLVVTYFVLVLFVLIVMVGILNTYRVLVYERTKEIGTMRALGMSRSGVSSLFMIEAFCLAAIATSLGLLAGLGALSGLRLVDLSAIPAAGMITDRGRLGFYLAPKIIALNAAIMVAGVVAAASGPARKASMIRPVDALRSES